MVLYNFLFNHSQNLFKFVTFDIFKQIVNSTKKTCLSSTIQGESIEVINSLELSFPSFRRKLVRWTENLYFGAITSKV